MSLPRRSPVLSPPRPASLVLLIALASGLLTTPAAVAQPAPNSSEFSPGERDAAGTPAAGTPPTAAQQSALAEQQQQLAERYRKIEELLLRLADVEAAENPERAALLRRGARQSREKFILDRLNSAAASLSSEEYQKAINDQKAAQQELVSLLKLLMTEDRPQRIREEKERVTRWIKDLKRLERSERGIRARAENGADLSEIEAEQKSVTERAEEIEAELREQEGPLDGAATEAESPQGEAQDSPSPADKAPTGEPKEGESADRQATEPQPDEGDAAQGELQPETPAAGESSEDPAGENQPQEGQPAQSPSGESPSPEGSSQAGKPSESKPSEGKPSDDSPPQGQPQEGGSSESQPSESQPSESQRSESQRSQGQPQQSGGQSPQGQQSPPSPQQSPATPKQAAQQALEQARRNMQRAQEKLEQAQRKEAVEAQLQAEQELREAIERLERILRQLREEEMLRELARIEARLRKMAQMQTDVLDKTVALAKTPEDQRDRQTDIAAGNLAFEEKKIVLEADRAILLLREEGSSVAFPEVVQQMRGDMVRVAERLTQTKIDAVTQGIQEDILAALEEMIAALQQAQRDLEKQQQQSQQGQSQQGQAGEQPLVQPLAELKLIRTMQTRIKTTTERYGEMIPAEPSAPVDEDLLGLLQNLSDRQQKLYRITRDLLLRRNQ